MLFDFIAFYLMMSLHVFMLMIVTDKKALVLFGWVILFALCWIVTFPIYAGIHCRSLREEQDSLKKMGRIIL